jgi:cytochrome c-type protein NapB
VRGAHRGAGSGEAVVKSRRLAEPGRLIRRVAWIVIAVVAMAQILFLVLPESDGPPEFRTVAIVPEPVAGQPIRAEVGPFLDLKEGLDRVSTSEGSPHVVVPTRAYRRVRRAYEGAPPWIPHAVTAELQRTQDCTPCHNFGGYNPGIRTYSPRSPHPEYTNCMQCHVRPETNTLFEPTDWTEPPWPEYGGDPEVVGGPPRIPHTLELRERCLSCHGGGSAAPDIRTSHPEQFNCRQCHLPTVAPGAVYTRSGGNER